jgi:ribose 5-phosphate isomerase B
MRSGITTDYGGFGLKDELVTRLKTAGPELVDLGACTVADYPDYALPLAGAVVAGQVDRGIAICGSGVSSSVCANKVNGVRAALIHDHFSAKQGVEDDHINILCMGGRAAGTLLAWDLVATFLNAKFSQEPRHLWRLGKAARGEAEKSH